MASDVFPEAWRAPRAPRPQEPRPRHRSEDAALESLRARRADLRSVEDRATGIARFAERIVGERNLYGSLAFAETAESLRLCARALQVGPQDRVAGVTSSGDVLLALLARGPEAVVGFDANPMQTALAHLKLASIGALDVQDYLELLGVDVADAPSRIKAFDRISRALPGDVRSLLLKRRDAIGTGILNQGMTHLIIRALVASLRRVVDRDTMSLFLGERGSNQERRHELERLVNKPSMRVLLRPMLRAFSAQLKWLFFPHRICRVSNRPDEMIADFFRTFAPLFELGARNNPVLSRSATGVLHEEWTSHLYNATAFDRIRLLSRRIDFETADIIAGLRSVRDGWATRIYLSNVPDYLSPDDLGALADEIDRVAAPNARVLYFSLCDVDRLQGLIGPPIPRDELDAIRASDTVRLYPNIVVRKAGGS